MKVKILSTVVIVLCVIAATLAIGNYNLKNKKVDLYQLELAKEKLRQERLFYQNEIYKVREEKRVLLKVLEIYDSTIADLKQNDQDLRNDLNRRTNQIKEFSIEELEDYFKDEFKDFQ